MSFRNVLTGNFTEEPTVYKLHFGKKYYIWKGKNLKHSVETVCNDIDRFIGKGVPADHLLKKVVDYVTRGRILFCRVEVLLQTVNLSELIDFENLSLKQSKEDPECLNIKFDAHVPKWISEANGQVQNLTTENKPITDTFVNTDVSKHQSRPDLKPVAERKPSIAKSGLMDALSKLKK